MSEPNADCAAVLARLAQFLDGECVEAEADEIRGHLDACDRCVEDADVALALKALVQRCCRAAAAPQTLRTAIWTTYSCTQQTSVEYTEITTVRFPPQ
jgi:anti-sigma factor (TIGR02949 family)